MMVFERVVVDTDALESMARDGARSDQVELARLTPGPGRAKYARTLP